MMMGKKHEAKITHENILFQFVCTNLATDLVGCAFFARPNIWLAGHIGPASLAVAAPAHYLLSSASPGGKYENATP